MIFYRQCTLKHQNIETVAWIEDKELSPGCSVTLSDSEFPEWWWEVTSIGKTQISRTEAQERAREAVAFKRMGSIASQ